MSDEITDSDFSVGVDHKKRRTLKLLGAAAVGLMLPSSSANPGHHSEVATSEVDKLEKTIEDIRDEILAKYGVEVFIPEEDFQLHDLLDRFRRRPKPKSGYLDEIGGVPYDIVSVAWKVLEVMNVNGLPYDRDHLLSERNIGVLRSIPIYIQRPTIEDMDFARTALDLLPKSLYSKLHLNSDSRQVRLFMLRGLPREPHGGGLSLHLHHPGPFYRHPPFSGLYYGSSPTDHDFIIDMNLLNGHSKNNLRSLKWAFGTVIHELFHGVGYEPPARSIEYLGQDDDSGRYALDPYTYKILDILGFIRPDKEHSEIADVDGFMHVLEIHGHVQKKHDEEGDLSYSSNTYLGYGGSKHNRRYSIALVELLPVTAKMYLDGREAFVKEFGEVFGEYPAGKLYEYIRDTFFDGREFRDGELEEIAQAFSEKHSRQ